MKKNGFTLIELLAVIVILAIIALIVTPVVSGIITSARNSANARSVEGHIRNVELAIMSDAFATGAGDLAIYDRTSGTLPSGLTIPTNDNITCKKYTISNGQVVEATKCANKSDTANWHKTYKYTASNGAEPDGELGEKAFTVVAAQTGETHQGIVYMDPTDLDTKCDQNSDINVTSRTTKSGCMKFYIFGETDDGKYKMILDRNISSNNTAWISYDDFIAAGGKASDWNTNKTIKGSITATTRLNESTVNWMGNPRMITSTEILTIANISCTSWCFFGSENQYTPYSSQSAEQKAKQQSLYWLFDYTNDCVSYGCKTNYNSTNGYWASDTDNNGGVWSVSRQGTFDLNSANSSYGLRPVLEISKDLID